MIASSGQPSHEQAAPATAGNSVNDALTPKRRRPITENSEYAAFARRIVRAYSRRIATGDVELLTYLIGLADNVNEAIQQAVNGLRMAGDSWTPGSGPAAKPRSNAGANHHATHRPIQALLLLPPRR